MLDYVYYQLTSLPAQVPYIDIHDGELRFYYLRERVVIKRNNADILWNSYVFLQRASTHPMAI